MFTILGTSQLTFLFHEASGHVFCFLSSKTDYVSIGAAPTWQLAPPLHSLRHCHRDTSYTRPPTMAASHLTLFSTTDTLCLLVSTLVATQHCLHSQTTSVSTLALQLQNRQPQKHFFEKQLQKKGLHLSFSLIPSPSTSPSTPPFPLPLSLPPSIPPSPSLYSVLCPVT